MQYNLLSHLCYFGLTSHSCDLLLTECTWFNERIKRHGVSGMTAENHCSCWKQHLQCLSKTKVLDCWARD